MALAIQGIFSPGEISNAIAAKDTKSLTRVSGVGAKLAERITTELKNKIGKMPLGAFEVKSSSPGSLPPVSANEDAVSALVNLGYSRMEAYNAVASALGRLGTGEHKLDAIIKESLRDLMR